MKGKNLFFAAYLLLIILAGLATVFVNKLVSELPEIETYEYRPPLTTSFYDINNKLITELYTQKRIFVSIDKIPKHVQQAFIATEDHNFYKHWGISFRGALRATIANLLAGRVVEGGSTITQQLAKVLFLTQERTITRKLKELLLSLRLEANYSKQEILEMYLNHIYFGHGIYGIEAAARSYFGKPAFALTLSEAATLAAILRNPSQYSPFVNVNKATQRRNVVLLQMYKLKMITKEEYINSKKEPLIVSKGYIPTTYGSYFIEAVRQYLESKYGSNAIYYGGLKIYTTMDLELQKIAEQVMNSYLERFDLERASATAVKQISSTTTSKVQGGLVCIDVETGEIRALVGGRDFRESQFNRALQARRQPGSAFKPILYAAAIDLNVVTPSTLIEDLPSVYVYSRGEWNLLLSTYNLDTTRLNLPEDKNKVWIPENYLRKYHGPVTVRKALEFSLNICAIKLMERVGVKNVISYAQKLGIKSTLRPHLSLALGTGEVTLLELTSAFSVFPRNGVYIEPYFIRRIEDRDGKALEENFPTPVPVLDPRTSYIMTSLLKGVVERGTGRYAGRIIKGPIAGKTGTTNNFTDAWFIGYSPKLAAGVWVGYDDARSLGEKMSGGHVACPIWTEFMKEAIKLYPAKDFTVPEGLVFRFIDPKTGLLSLPGSQNKFLEVFKKGQEPTQYATAALSTSISPGSTFYISPEEAYELDEGF
jgi:penicillin-binding protein 1A